MKQKQTFPLWLKEVLIIIAMISSCILIIFAGIIISKGNKTNALTEHWETLDKKDYYNTSGYENMDFSIFSINDIPTTFRESFIKCQEALKSCSEKINDRYHIYIVYYGLYAAFNPPSADSYYMKNKSPFQYEFTDFYRAKAIYPIYIYSLAARHLGYFVAVCQDGTFPIELNKELPCQ